MSFTTDAAMVNNLSRIISTLQETNSLLRQNYQLNNQILKTNNEILKTNLLILNALEGSLDINVDDIVKAINNQNTTRVEKEVHYIEKDSSNKIQEDNFNVLSSNPKLKTKETNSKKESKYRSKFCCVPNYY